MSAYTDAHSVCVHLYVCLCVHMQRCAFACISVCAIVCIGVWLCVCVSVCDPPDVLTPVLGPAARGFQLRV